MNGELCKEHARLLCEQSKELRRIGAALLGSIDEHGNHQPGFMAEIKTELHSIKNESVWVTRIQRGILGFASALLVGVAIMIIKYLPTIVDAAEIVKGAQ